MAARVEVEVFGGGGMEGKEVVTVIGAVGAAKDVGGSRGVLLKAFPVVAEAPLILVGLSRTIIYWRLINQ